jgi:hypothetical protein
MAGGDCRAPIMRSIGKNAMGSVGGMPVIAQFNLFQGLSNSGGRDLPIAVAYEITDFGKTALSFLDALKTWAETHDI